MRLKFIKEYRTLKKIIFLISLFQTKSYLIKFFIFMNKSRNKKKYFNLFLSEGLSNS